MLYDGSDRSHQDEWETNALLYSTNGFTISTGLTTGISAYSIVGLHKIQIFVLFGAYLVFML